MEFVANVTEITQHSVTYEKNGETVTIPNDFVLQ